MYFDLNAIAIYNNITQFYWFETIRQVFFLAMKNKVVKLNYKLTSKIYKYFRVNNIKTFPDNSHFFDL